MVITRKTYCTYGVEHNAKYFLDKFSLEWLLHCVNLFNTKQSKCFFITELHITIIKAQIVSKLTNIRHKSKLILLDFSEELNFLHKFY